jgi:hypothetical protein
VWRPCLAASLLVSACCVSPPLTQEWLAVGFREPGQTIKTFQTAVRADAPDLEYRCFSAGFRKRNGISKLTWREAREELRNKNPWLRRGIADMRVEGDVDVLGGRATATCVTHGRHIRIGLVREDFAELWSGAMLLSDEPDVEFDKHTQMQHDAQGFAWFYGWAVLNAGPEAPDVTEVHVGREWKIDAIETVEDGGDTDRGQATSHQEPQ